MTIFLLTSSCEEDKKQNEFGGVSMTFNYATTSDNNESDEDSDDKKKNIKPSATEIEQEGDGDRPRDFKVDIPDIDNENLTESDQQINDINAARITIGSSTPATLDLTIQTSYNRTGLSIGSTFINVELLDNIGSTTTLYQQGKTVNIIENQTTFVTFINNWTPLNQTISWNSSQNSEYEVGETINLGWTNTHAERPVVIELFESDVNNIIKTINSNYIGNNYDWDTSSESPRSNIGFKVSSTIINNTSTSTCCINLISGNAAPIANDINESASDEDTAVSISLDGSDEDGDNLTYSIVSNPSNGSLGSISGNSITYTPNQDWNGTDTFTYKANDGQLDSNTATVTLTVNSINDAPTTVDVSAEMDENLSMDRIVGITLEGNDVDGDNLTYSIVSDPSNGYLSDLSDNTLTYNPNQDWNGVDTFTYKVNDGQEDSNVSTVTVTVNAVNDDPVVVDNPMSENDYSLYFDGSDDYVVIPGEDFKSLNSHDYSISLWVKTDDLNPAGFVSRNYFNNDNNTDAGFSLKRVADGRISFMMSHGNGSNVDVFELMTSNIVPPANEWFHIAVDRDTPFTGSTYNYKMYINGVEVSSHTHSNTNLSDEWNFNDNNVGLLFGQSDNSNTLNERLRGHIDEVAIINDMLNLSGARGLYNNGFGQNATENNNSYFNAGSVVAYYNFEEGQGFTANDIVYNSDGSNKSDGQINGATYSSDVFTPTLDEGIFTTDEDVGFDIELSSFVSDIDGDNLDYGIVLNPTHGNAALVGSILTYTPNQDWNGLDNLKWNVSDGSATSNSGTINITVDPVNDAPTTDGGKTYSTPKNIPISITLGGNDIDGDALSYIITEDNVTSSGHGTLSLDGNVATITPTSNPSTNINVNFRYKVNDGNLDSEESSNVIVYITANEFTNPISGQVWKRGNTETIAWNGNFENDPWGIYLVRELDNNGPVTTITDGGIGSIQSFDYTIPTSLPNASDYQIFIGQLINGVHDGEYITSDLFELSDNSQPSANDMTISGAVNTALDFTLEGSDGDGDALSYIIVTQPKDGTITGIDSSVLDDNTGTYSPNTNNTGVDSFTYKVNDGTHDSAIGTVLVGISNSAPSTADVTFATDEDTPYNYTLPAQDAEGDSLTYIVVNGPNTNDNNGSASISGHIVTFTPNQDWNGSDYFTVRANDRLLDGNNAKISMQVDPVDDPPYVSNPEYGALEDTNKVFGSNIVHGLGGDIDGPGTLSFNILSGPFHGSFVASPFVYRGDQDWFGTDSLTYAISNNTGGGSDQQTSEVGVWKIIVAPVNDLPVTKNISKTLSKNVPLEIDLLESDENYVTDVDNDLSDITFRDEGVEWEYQGYKTVINGQILTITPIEDWTGNGSGGSYQAIDLGEEYSNTSAIVVSIIDDAPTANDISVSTEQDLVKSVTFDGEDINGDDLTYSIVSSPSNGTLGNISGNTVLYTPNTSWNGTDTFTYKANDGTTDSNTATVTISVTNSSIQVTYPNGSENFSSAETVTITWNGGFSNTGIRLFENGSSVLDINTDVGSVNSYDWVIPSTLTSSNSYKIRVYDNGAGGTNYDDSDNAFNVNQAKVVTVDTPSTVLSSTDFTSFSWTIVDGTNSSGFEKTGVELWKDGAKVLDLGIIDNINTKNFGPWLPPYHATIECNPAIENGCDGQWSYPMGDHGGYQFRVYDANDSNNPSEGFSGTFQMNLDNKLFTINGALQAYYGDIKTIEINPEINDVSGAASLMWAIVAVGDQGEDFNQQSGDLVMASFDYDRYQSTGEYWSCNAGKCGIHFNNNSASIIIPYGPTFGRSFEGEGSRQYRMKLYAHYDAHNEKLFYINSWDFTLGGFDSNTYGSHPHDANGSANVSNMLISKLSNREFSDYDKIPVTWKSGVKPSSQVRLDRFDGTGYNNMGGSYNFNISSENNVEKTYNYYAPIENESFLGDLRFAVIDREAQVFYINNNLGHDYFVYDAASDIFTDSTSPLVAPSLFFDSDTMHVSINKPEITITSPSNGSIVKLGEPLTVTWNTSSMRNATIGNIRVDYKGSGGDMNWVDGVDNNGSYTFTPKLVDVYTSSFQPGQSKEYEMFIEANNVYDLNDDTQSSRLHTSQGIDITIDASEVPTPTVLFPNGGETFVEGNPYTLTWNFEAISDSVKIELLGGQAHNASNVQWSKTVINSGSYTLTIPDVPQEDSNNTEWFYKFSVKSILNSPDEYTVGTYHDNSDEVFTITVAGVVITSPNGGETWVPGSSHDITWNGGFSNTGIQLYKDGTKVSTPNEDVGSVNSWNWTVPSNQTVGTDYKIYVHDAGSGEENDLSDANFTINTTPTSSAVSASTNEDTAKTITLSATDVDGNSLTYSIVSNPSNGSLGSVSGTSVTYTPTANWNGTDTFTYKANDGIIDSNTSTVTVTVAAVNDVPVTAAVSASTNEDTATTITLSATDVEGSSLTYSIVSNPSNGSLGSVSGTSVVYTPNTNWNGTDTFTYKANDGIADSNTATITVTVTAVNDPPTTNDESVSTNEDTAINITLGATDVDVIGNLTYSIASNPSNGSVSLSESTATYTPNANWSGIDTFTWKANDGTVDSNTATVTVTVAAVNDVPVASAVSASTNEDTAVTITLSATDIDGDNLTYSIVSNPSNGSLGSVSGTSVVYTPTANWNGTDTFTYKANDGIIDSNTSTVTVTVNNIANFPGENASYTIPEVAASGPNYYIEEIAVAASGRLTDINVKTSGSLSVQNADQLRYYEMFLVSPNNTRVLLFKGDQTPEHGIGNSLSKISTGLTNTYFDQDAGTSFYDGSGSFIGSYRPDESLDNFNGEEINGTWKVIITNNSPFTGTGSADTSSHPTHLSLDISYTDSGGDSYVETNNSIFTTTDTDNWVLDGIGTKIFGIGVSGINSINDLDLEISLEGDNADALRYLTISVDIGNSNNAVTIFQGDQVTSNGYQEASHGMYKARFDDSSSVSYLQRSLTSTRISASDLSSFEGESLNEVRIYITNSSPFKITTDKANTKVYID